MKFLENPYLGSGLPGAALADIPMPSTAWTRPIEMLEHCPAAQITPLLDAKALAAHLKVARVMIKDERARMGLGSFKALGAAYVIACDHAQGKAKGRTYVTASAGNHGLSVAAGAAAFGAHSVIYLAETVPKSFARRLEDIGAEVKRSGKIYEESMQAAQQAAADTGATLLSDSSWPGYLDRPWQLMEGYTAIAAEILDQTDEIPSHIFLQAGVGGMAGALAAAFRTAWGTAPHIAVVEPEVAPALFASIDAGRAVTTQGPPSEMGRLDCKEPSLIALKGLAQDANSFITISEAEGLSGATLAQNFGFPSTPSGSAGLAALSALRCSDTPLQGLSPEASVLLVLSEAAA